MDINEIQVIHEKTELVAQDFTKLADDYLVSMGNKLPETQRKQFLEICRAFALNPFKREIYAVPYGNDFNIIVGFEVYLKRAERSGKLSGWKVWTEGEGNQIKAVIEIHRRDFDFPFTHEVYLSEYSTGKAMWAKSPKTMIKKVAMSQGFRLCFPDELDGMPYTSEEIAEELSDEALKSANIAETVAPEVQGAPAFTTAEKSVFSREQAEEASVFSGNSFQQEENK